MNNMNGMDHAHHMSDGCGNLQSSSAVQFIDVNHMMHGGMAINFSCSHDLDFVRGMMPHHAGAIAMCQIMTDLSKTEPDAYLIELCANITRLQRAEISWMEKWLVARDHSLLAPCKACSNGMPVPEPTLSC